jgi:phosphoribosylformimino-5-aminoimidazole carboxamide ribotide isomerase
VRAVAAGRRGAADYEAAGAKRIHVVDLDGAFSGEPKNLDTIRRIREGTSCEVEVGGGIRTREAAEALLSAGANYIVIGTKALESPEFVSELTSAHDSRIIVGADARDGKLSTRGWTHDSDVDVVPYLRKLEETAGVKTVIFTDIARDGMFNSPNLTALEEVLALDGLEVIASGGVGSTEDVLALESLNKQNLRGVIVGKALYDGRMDLRRAIEALGRAK